ncbi:MAG: ATPase, partial [Chloroflexota bacterium]
AEILSQLGTRITGKLTDERDIEGVLMGVANRTFLRNALNSLNTRQQVLITGHAVPMPIVLRTRPYDEVFYKDMGSSELTPEGVKKDLTDLFGSRKE